MDESGGWEVWNRDIHLRAAKARRWPARMGRLGQ
jgi:hypothetical protein